MGRGFEPTALSDHVVGEGDRLAEPRPEVARRPLVQQDFVTAEIGGFAAVDQAQRIRVLLQRGHCRIRHAAPVRRDRIR